MAGKHEIEWRWVDEKGRVMTNWNAGPRPPMDSVSDDKGIMRVETRATQPLPPTNKE